MRKLFLTSTGLPSETRQFFLNLIDKPPQKAKVAFIPTAADPETNKWFVDASKNQLMEIGFPFQEVDLKEDPKTIREKLEGSDIIYINGGNTFYLLDWIRKSGLDKYLGELLDKGKIYLGVSAGSIIAGSDITVAGWGPGGDKNTVKLKSTLGLKFVPYAISPHYTEDDRELLDKKSKILKQDICALKDKQALIVEGDFYTWVGKRRIIFSKEPLRKPEYFYHASSLKTIEILEPRKETIRDEDEGPVVFGSSNIAYTSMFLVRSDDTWSAKGISDGVVYNVIGDEKRFRELDNGGSIYFLPTDSFYHNEGSSRMPVEWVSKKPVKPVKREDYSSALETMITKGVQVYFCDKSTLKKIQHSNDHGRKIIRNLVSENQKQGRFVNPIPD